MYSCALCGVANIFSHHLSPFQLWCCHKSKATEYCLSKGKGEKLGREFHAWRVERMAPVFSLFEHANELYADEQT